MPDKKTIQAAKRDAREGKSPSTQAGEFVRKEIDDIRAGKHGARNTKQAIAIGLSEARRAGVKLKQPKKGTVSEKTRKNAKSETTKGQRHEPISRKRSEASTRALKKEGKEAASPRALSKQASTKRSTRTTKRRSTTTKSSADTKKPSTDGKQSMERKTDAKPSAGMMRQSAASKQPFASFQAPVTGQPFADRQNAMTHQAIDTKGPMARAEAPKQAVHTRAVNNRGK